MKLGVILILFIAGLYPVYTIYTQHFKTSGNTEKSAEDLAMNFLQNSPTYNFDGIPGSMKMVGSNCTKKPATWSVMIEFKSSHEGYGDRTGQTLREAVTLHKIEIVVDEGKVIQAIIDGAWDEITQRRVKEDEEEPTENSAVEIALQFLYGGPTFSFDGIHESVKVVNVVRLEDQYTWSINISFYCRHSGYGNRTGHMLLQVITSHEIMVRVKDSVVISAIIDDEWDELAAVSTG